MFVPPIVRFAAFPAVVPVLSESTLVMNFCREVWAVAASLSVSCWKMNRTAARAKSIISSLTVNEFVGCGIAVVLLGEIVVDEVGVGVGTFVVG